MEFKRIPLFEDYGFFGRVLGGNKYNEELKKQFSDHIKRIKYDRIIFKDEDQILLLGGNNNIIYAKSIYELADGYSIYEGEMKLNEIDVIEIIIIPPTVKDSLGDHTIAGLLMYGFTGAIVGSIIDSYKGPEREDVSVDFRFGDGKLFGGPGITYHVYKEKK